MMPQQPPQQAPQTVPLDLGANVTRHPGTGQPMIALNTGVGSVMQAGVLISPQTARQLAGLLIDAATQAEGMPDVATGPLPPSSLVVPGR